MIKSNENSFKGDFKQTQKGLDKKGHGNVSPNGSQPDFNDLRQRGG